MTDAELPLADLTGKARIRHVALHLFAIRGCAQTPLRLIAEKALVSLALISHHFGTKHALRDAVERYIVSCFEKAIDEIPQTARFAGLLVTFSPLSATGRNSSMRKFAYRSPSESYSKDRLLRSFAPGVVATTVPGFTRICCAGPEIGDRTCVE